MTNSELIEEILHNASQYGMLDAVRDMASRLLAAGDFTHDTQSLAYEHAYRELIELPLITKTLDDIYG
jgi:hypothetical protein